MSALFVLIGISILVAGSFLAAFLFSVKKGQFDDDYTPSVRMLFDDELKKAPPSDRVIRAGSTVASTSTTTSIPKTINQTK